MFCSFSLCQLRKTIDITYRGFLLRKVSGKRKQIKEMVTKGAKSENKTNQNKNLRASLEIKNEKNQ
jgi:hypothetical protein